MVVVLEGGVGDVWRLYSGWSWWCCMVDVVLDGNGGDEDYVWCLWWCMSAVMLFGGCGDDGRM